MLCVWSLIVLAASRLITSLGMDVQWSPSSPAGKLSSGFRYSPAKKSHQAVSIERYAPSWVNSSSSSTPATHLLLSPEQLVPAF